MMGEEMTDNRVINALVYESEGWQVDDTCV